MKVRELLQEADTQFAEHQLKPLEAYMRLAACGDVRDVVMRVLADLAAFVFESLQELPEGPARDATLEEIADVEMPDAMCDIFRREVEETLSGIGGITQKELPPLPIEDEAAYEEFAEKVPIPAELLHAPASFGEVTGESLLEIGKGRHLGEHLYDYLYKTLVFRPERPKGDMDMDVALRETEQAVALAKETLSRLRQTDAGMPDVLEPGEYAKIPEGYQVSGTILTGRHCCIFDDDNVYFPFHYFPKKGEADNNGEPTLRVYISIDPARKEHIGQLYVELLQELRKAGIRLGLSKANGPAVVDRRLDNMIFHISPDQRDSAEHVIAAFLESRALGKGNMVSAQRSGIEGLSWAAELTDAQSTYGQFVFHEPRVSYNGYVAARIAPHFMRRVIAHIESTGGDLNAAQLLRYELERIGRE